MQNNQINKRRKFLLKVKADSTEIDGGDVVVVTGISCNTNGSRGRDLREYSMRYLHSG